MTLATHAVIAAAVAKPAIAIHPLLGFVVAFASHYFADAIPHGDYNLRSLKDDEPAEKRKFSSRSDFLYDLWRIAFDGILGAAIVLAIFRPASLEELLTWFSVILGGMLPDLLQGIYYTRRAEFLRPVQVFHDYMHTKIKLGPYPLVGVPMQAAIFLFFLSTIT